jgi:hypothetical protein
MEPSFLCGFIPSDTYGAEIQKGESLQALL